MKEKLIEFIDFSFKYNSQQSSTLKNINLTIYKNEKILVLGESGCGKSTLFNSINGLVPFFYQGEISGNLEIKNKNTKNMSIFEISKSVATILQDTDNQFIALTSAEDIAFKLENLCVNQKVMHEKVNKISSLIGVNDFLNSNPHNLSGGQKQRVTLGGVLVDDSEILIFDEPLANLDPKTSEETINLINKITEKTPKTVIIIEHRLEEVLKLNFDRVLLMHNGCIVFDGEMNKLLCSSLLKKYGIREPLYLTALKYAGCNVEKYPNVFDIKNLDISPFKHNIETFYNDLKYFNPHNIIDSSSPLLRCENINFSYNNKKNVLNNVSFDVYKNELLCIVGKNGAGKSTISKIICGFLKPSSGKILFNNKDITNSTIFERSSLIGYVMQNPNQMISHNLLFDEVAFTLKNMKLNKNEIETKVYNILKICGLYEFRNWPISALSFGQKRRVTIASILVSNPKILILDEPTAGQDFNHYNKVMEFIKSLKNHGITSIMITHDMNLLMEYADRCIVISDGKKIGDDIPSKILSNDDIIKNANLKKTSLHSISEKLSLNNTEIFINKFITYDRSTRDKNETCS
ncbi:ABC transporter ATP-binding protein [Candidatus Arthromitus sp. SFB-rat-Yit]|uniref:ABC transporter ATP-binding protein n=1 Tax=Candidatus Arthromitus sp. SFB-rat-Yit TaxID=1041504 RepID=UPI000227A12A|nr:ABC transporter ATP-binding protein [Candidatus Arthromitus sp. SFB-rat-Yit]BAK81873.1 cobalt import ATP-binding protein CbiO [Candidatus Arthromitus sp. SFB-rat-Yit]